MKNKTQQEKVVEFIEANGHASRNWCLQNYITRLGAIICDLKKEGWEFNGYYKKYENGKDYVYELKRKPQPIQSQMLL